MEKTDTFTLLEGWNFKNLTIFLKNLKIKSHNYYLIEIIFCTLHFYLIEIIFCTLHFDANWHKINNYAYWFDKKFFLNTLVLMNGRSLLLLKYVILTFPADIGRAGFARPWEPAKLTSQLMKRPNAQHSATHMESQNRMRDNQSSWTLVYYYKYNIIIL